MKIFINKLLTEWGMSFSGARKASKPYPIEVLVTFRVMFGFITTLSTLRFIALGWVEDHFINTKFQFKFYGFHWVDLLFPAGMYVVHFLLLVSALGILFGFFYRISSILFFICFTYTELIDLSYYLNHYYYISVTSFLLIFLPAHRNVSLDLKFGRVKPLKYIPFWMVGLIRLQISLLYIYAGLAKINYSWLIEAMPLKMWLPAADQLPLIGSIMRWRWLSYAFSWMSMFYDTLIVFFLINKYTRWYAYTAVIFFHGMVGLLFQIGIFPLVMICCTPVFFNTEFHISLWKKLSYFSEKGIQKSLPSWLVIYGLFQILFPWRYLLYKNNNLFWTEDGYRFSWRVMLMEKAGTATFYVKDTQTGKEGQVINAEFLRPHQEKQMAMQPDMILQYAHFLKKEYQNRGVYKPEVRAEVYITLNAKPSQLYFDPHLNLCTINDSWNAKSWLNKME